MEAKIFTGMETQAKKKDVLVSTTAPVAGESKMVMNFEIIIQLSILIFIQAQRMEKKINAIVTSKTGIVLIMVFSRVLTTSRCKNYFLEIQMVHTGKG